MLVGDNIELLNIWEIIANHELLGYRTIRQPEVPSPGVGEDLAPLPPFGLHMNPITYSYITYFYKDAYFQGWRLGVKMANISDLSRVAMDMYSIHSWDRQISSLSNDTHVRCRLYDIIILKDQHLLRLKGIV
ncbi:hypothetical protein [Paenibacillus riograndensis]|nr:hypothetical protein [Paenibacillus riograndensis]